MSLFWLGTLILLSVPIAVALLIGGVYLYVRFRMVDNLMRIFTERPLFIIPRGSPRDGAEEVEFPTTDGLTLQSLFQGGALSCLAWSSVPIAGPVNHMSSRFCRRVTMSSHSNRATRARATVWRRMSHCSG